MNMERLPGTESEERHRQNQLVSRLHHQQLTLDEDGVSENVPSNHEPSSNKLPPQWHVDVISW